MTKTIAERNRLAAQTRHLDQAVAEVFEVMIGVVCRPAVPGSAPEADARVTAIVGLAGGLHGVCVLRMREPAALKLAESMVGAPVAGFDRTVTDALGEICNMLAGAWKGKLAGLASTCMLSVPAVISGSDYEFHLPAPAFHLDRSYVFEGNGFTFSIDCAGL